MVVVSVCAGGRVRRSEVVSASVCDGGLVRRSEVVSASVCDGGRVRRSEESADSVCAGGLVRRSEESPVSGSAGGLVTQEVSYSMIVSGGVGVVALGVVTTSCSAGAVIRVLSSESSRSDSVSGDCVTIGVSSGSVS